MAFGASTAGDDSALPRTEEDVPRLGQHKRGRVVQAQGKLSAEDAKAKRGRNCIILICSTNVVHNSRYDCSGPAALALRESHREGLRRPPGAGEIHQRRSPRPQN